MLCFCRLWLLTRYQSSSTLPCYYQKPVLTNHNISLFTLKWYEKQKSAFPAARVIFRLHWREKKKRSRKCMWYYISDSHGEWGRGEMEKERHGVARQTKWREKGRDERERKKGRGRDSHTQFASSLGISSGLQGENYCTSPRRARVTSLTTLINWKSVIAQTALLSAC